MSGGGTETPVACDAAQGGGGKKRDSLGTPGAAHLIIKGTEWRAWSSVRGGGSVLGSAPRGAPGISCRPQLPVPSLTSLVQAVGEGRTSGEWELV